MQRVVEDSTVGYELVSREQAITSQGLPVEVVEFTVLAPPMKATRLIYLYEGRIGFNAAFVAQTARHDALRDLINYSLGTFEVQGMVP